MLFNYYKLQKGVKVNHQDFYGQTALHYAAENGHVEAVQVLIKAGKHL